MKQKRRIRIKRTLKARIKNGIFRVRNIFSLISFILVVLFIVFLGKMNLLPNRYLFLIGEGLVILDLISIFLINVHKKIGLKILGGIIMGLLTIICSVGLYYTITTSQCLENAFTKKMDVEKSTYYVVSAKSNNYKESDIAGEVSVYDGTIHMDKALDKLNNKYKVKTKKYDEVGKLFDNVLNKTDKFMLVEKTSYEIVFSFFKDYKSDDFDIIYKYDIYTKRKNSGSSKTDKFNIYISGTDFSGLTDFNMLATVNTKTHKVLLTSIPRDYYIDVAGRNGVKDKLSFMGAYGGSVSKDSLAKLFGVDVDYIVTLNTDSLVEIVDYVGGIDFCSDKTYTTTHALVRDTYNDNGKKLTIVKGCQHLNGIEALTLARERNAFPGRDRERQKNCQQILIAILKKLMSTDTMLHYNETLNTLGTLYDTDISKNVISNVSKDVVNNGNKWKFETQSVDGTDKKDRVHSSGMIDWVMYPSQKTVDAAKNKINETLK